MEKKSNALCIQTIFGNIIRNIALNKYYSIFQNLIICTQAQKNILG